MRGGRTTVCPLCKDGPDAIEHMAKCAIVRRLFNRFDCSCSNLIQFLALDQFSFPLRILTKVKLLNVIYTVHNSLNSSSSPLQVNSLINAAASIIMQ